MGPVVRVLGIPCENSLVVDAGWFVEAIPVEELIEQEAVLAVHIDHLFMS